MNFVKGARTCDLFYLETDKEIYYNDETIYINASWNLDYDTGDKSYVQIRIFNESNDLIWFSPKYNEKGISNKIWTVVINELNITFKNPSNILNITFFYYNAPFVGSPEGDYLDPMILIKTIKRNTSCQLIECPKYINIGQQLQFKAVFYNISLDNKSYLVNYTIFFKIVSKGIPTYHNNFTTNSSGMIQIMVPSDNLTAGINTLRFEIRDNKFYNDLILEHIIYVKLSTFESSKSEGDGSKGENSIEHSVVTIISILTISILVFTIILYNSKKRTKPKKLVDITFKY